MLICGGTAAHGERRGRTAKDTVCSNLFLPAFSTRCVRGVLGGDQTNPTRQTPLSSSPPAPNGPNALCFVRLRAGRGGAPRGAGEGAEGRQGRPVYLAMYNSWPTRGEGRGLGAASDVDSRPRGRSSE